ncbi:hypothetical protein Emag_000987 [Eimeria magna]
MEPTGHGCTVRSCNVWGLQLSAVLWRKLFLIIFAATASHVSALPQPANTLTVQQQPAGAPGARSPGMSPSGSVVSSVSMNGPSRSRMEEVQAGDTLEQLGSPGQPESGIVASEEDASKLQTLSAAVESRAQGLSDRQRSSSRELSSALTTEEATEEPLTVAERVRRRFHSQKLFREDEKSDDTPALDPLPKGVVEEMLKEAQMESTSTNSATKVVCLSNCSMHVVEAVRRTAAATGSVLMGLASAQMDFSEKIVRKKAFGSTFTKLAVALFDCGNLSKSSPFVESSLAFLVCVFSASENYESEVGECPNDCSGNG